ncbi:hypothetical protein B0H11DRAFT_2024084 [Mycena galericulata]|nr:hypothetical protein B0H11DRAFT_2024084 [Mycena galericulata]
MCPSHTPEARSDSFDGLRSLNDRIAVLQQRNAENSTAPVGHAAPLRAKIAQFESKGGVPVPRGIGVPPVADKHRKGELYGNRMKPVWVPNARAGGAQRREESRFRGAKKLASALDPPASRSGVRNGPPLVPSKGAEGEETPSPSEEAFDDEVYHVLDEDAEDEGVSERIHPNEEAFDDDGYQVLGEPAGEEEAGVQGTDQPSEAFEEMLEIPGEETGENTDSDVEVSEEEIAYTIVHFTPNYSLPPPSTDPSCSPPEEIRPLVAEAAERSLPSPPLPPIAPSDEDDPDDEWAETPAKYGTITLRSPPRTQHAPPSPDWRAQGQTFSSVVHPRVCDPPLRTHEKRLPPTPTPLTPGFLGSELAVLVEDAAALERRLAAGELPAEPLRRLSVRPPPVSKDAEPAVEVEASFAAPGNVEVVSGLKTRPMYVFRNPLARKHKEDSGHAHPEHGSGHAEHEHATSRWFAGPAPTTVPFSSWRKLASTPRFHGTRS